MSRLFVYLSDKSFDLEKRKDLTPAMQYSYSSLFRPPKDLPKWFVRLNHVVLAPILLWPLIIFGSVFAFDKVKSFESAMRAILIVAALNSYPFILSGFVLASYNLFRKSVALAVLVLVPPIIGLIYAGVLIVQNS